MDIQSMSCHALRVLSQDSCVSPCERNWSSFSLVHTKLRNRLSVAQLERVIFCKANLRLLQSVKDLKGPRQVSPVLFETAFTDGSGDIDSSVHDEQDEIYRLLHSELKTFDRHVIRSRSRSLARGIDTEVVANVPSTSTAPPTSRGQRCKMRPRRRGDPVPLEDDIQDPDELFAGVSIDLSIMLIPDFDDEGNVLVMGGILSSEASSSEESLSLDDSTKSDD
ncbi:hypothetical protein KP509_15G029700 [Ceratopteris richardii]|uniref:HAT C-terminal dimerisation domain-containing protein n=1 Tax=Ceratopteris richardii TaxID=49495 RepID=A0A8T2T465_CERRI|nr:hypothetical protein KP509_15G029700 [Ceratopteris richardii]